MNLPYEFSFKKVVHENLRLRGLRKAQKSTNNFLFAKTVGIYLIPFIIVVIFYSYTTILGESILAIDILSFIIAVIIGQLASYRLLTSKKLPYDLESFLDCFNSVRRCFCSFYLLPTRVGYVSGPNNWRVRNYQSLNLDKNKRSIRLGDV